MRPRQITSPATLRQSINTEYKIVYCSTHWSVPCRNQYSILVKIAELYTGWKPIAQVDIERHPDLAAKLAIQSIPTILLFSRGREIHRIVGLQSLENLLKILADVLPAAVSVHFNDRTRHTHTEKSNQFLRG